VPVRHPIPRGTRCAKPGAGSRCRRVLP